MASSLAELSGEAGTVQTMPMITTDCPPINEYVRQPELRVTPRWFKRRAFPEQWIPHAHLRLPRLRDLAPKIEWCAQNDLGAISRENREWAERHFALDRVRKIWGDAVAARDASCALV